MLFYYENFVIISDKVEERNQEEVAEERNLEEVVDHMREVADYNPEQVVDYNPEQEAGRSLEVGHNLFAVEVR